MEGSGRRGLRAMWARRWFRRTTYTLVSGGLILGTAGWTVQRPFFTRWTTEKLDGLLRKETGLGLRLESLELHLFQGRLVAHRPVLGGNLFQAERLEVALDLGSLLFGELRIRNLDLDRPRIQLDAAGLRQIRLREHPPRTRKAVWEVERLSVRDGRLSIREASWGLPTTTASFSIHGEGKGPNHVRIFLDLLSLEVGEAPSALKGRMALQGEFNDGVISIQKGGLNLGRSQVAWQGRFETESEKLTSSASGSLDLGQLRRLFAPTAGELSGTLDFKTEAWGQARQPLWKLSLGGREIGSSTARLQPGTLELNASGSPAYASIHRVAWNSPDGRLEAQGTWRRGEGSRLQLHGRDVGLGPLAKFSRVAFLGEASADVEGEAYLPGDPWALPPLDRVELDLQATLARSGAPAGGANLKLKSGRLEATELDIRLPSFTFQGSGSARLAKRGLRDITGEGATDTDASVVAEVLQAWGIGDKEETPPGAIRTKVVKPFQMAGQAHVQAKVQWTGESGLQLSGECTVQAPRWHGAQADRLRAEVGIHRDELKIENIELFKGEGRGWGELWLTWSKPPKDQDEIDMCYRAFHLPVEEGLKAADLDLPLLGTGGGWVRIHGPYDHLRLEGGAQAEDASVYGLKIPAVSSDFSLDLEKDTLQLRDLRVGESLAGLGQGKDAPAGLLSLQGSMDMDLGRRTWQASLKGDLDSQRLGIPGPRFQARVEGSLEGPWIQPMGPMQVPMGHANFKGGRVFLGTQSLEGMEGSLESGAGGLNLRLGMVGKQRPFLSMQGWHTPQGLIGALDVQVQPETADTSHLATRLGRDLLQDLRLEATAEGVWNERGLAWKGRLNQLIGSFDGFELFQEGPTALEGDAAGAKVDLRLAGRSVPASQEGSVASFRASGRIPFNRETPMGLKLEGSAELAKLKPIADHLVELDSYSLLGDLLPRGSAHFDLALGGPYAVPTLDGTLSLLGGSLEVRGYPQSIEDLDFTLRFQGRDILLPEAEPARGLMAQGELSFWGKARWGFGGFESYDLRTKLEEFEFRDIPEGFELQGSLEASLKGSDEKGGVIKGAIQANRMLYRADINLRDLILSNAYGNLSGSSGLDPEDPLSRIELDLDLQLAEPWAFETNLLKLQGRPVGSFKILGTLARPGLKGKMEFLPGGRVTNLLPAGDIVLERGSIDFTDPRSTNPLLDLQGRVDISPYLVNLQIRGTLDALEMRPTSTPALRRDEITAILIDPSLAPSIGSASSASSAMSYGLAKTGSGLLTTLALADFQERVRRTFNLDRVNVAWRAGSSGNSESTVTLGKTLSLPGWRVPFVFTHKKTGEVTTISGQFEWRIGNLVLQVGASQSGATGLNPAGEIRHSWSPK